MSLEQELAANTAAIEANTAAVKALHAAWAQLTSQAAAIKAGVAAGEITQIKAGGTVVAKVESAPKAEKPAPTPPAPEMATPAVEVAAPVPATASPSEPPKEVTMEQLSAAVTSAATRNRDGVIKLLSERGVKRASELPKDQWAGIVTVLEAL